MDDYRQKLLDRFLKYVSIDTQSDPDSESAPSTIKQFDLLNILGSELRALGAEDINLSERGVLTGYMAASAGFETEPVIGFIAHVDTSPDMSGENVRPHVIDRYEGGDIPLNQSTVMRFAEFPELADFIGHTLITTDGTTLLGADDKAGVATIMTALEYLRDDPEIPHGRLAIAFTPDEEIGRGTENFDVEKFGAAFAYTIDGGALGELEYENFNAASAVIEIRGRNIHPGYAKNKMINALRLATEFDTALPRNERPETTEGYEGFYHLTSLKGDVEFVSLEYIIRNHSAEIFEAMKTRMRAGVESINNRYGDVARLVIKDQYRNMYEIMRNNMQVVERARYAMIQAGVEPVTNPIRGGTDGAQLSYMGLPCPNLFTGGMNFHGRYEYCSLDVMLKSVETIINIARCKPE